jgi:transposase InsO family protein
MVEKQTRKSIKILRSDQGGEYKSGDFNKYCKDNGIVQQFTVPHTPQQNGVAERKNRTLVECACSMMKGKNLSNAFWVEAINTAVYLKNRSPTRCLDNVTPLEALYGSKPAVHNLKVFGCKAFAHIPKENRKKLDRNSEPWWKSRQENPSKSSVQIKGESINQGTSLNVAKIME